MDTSQFLETEYAKQLISDIDKAESDVLEFNEKWRAFWSRNGGHIGTVLVGHLIVEHYMEDWLLAANPTIKTFDGTRLSFSQKLDLLENTESTHKWLFPGLRRLNRIRNKLAHDLTSEISVHDLAPIREIVVPWHEASGKPVNEGEALIVDFALLACTMLFVEAKSIRRYGKGYGYVAYADWRKKATRIE